MVVRNLSLILRRFRRQKLTTSLHLVGLTLGIAVCLLIGLFIRHELSYDAYQTKADRTYRINQVWSDFGQKRYHFSTPFPLADQIRKDIPGLELVTKIHHPRQTIIEINPVKKFKQDHVMMTDPEFLDVFDVEVVEGNAYEALRQPYQALLTESAAKKFFGNEQALGKTFTFNDSFKITVGGIIRDFPANTHLPASVLLSFADREKYLLTSTTHYGSVSGGSTFIVLPPGKFPDQGLQASLRSIYDRFLNNQPWMDKDRYGDIELQPLKDIHFNLKYEGGGQWVKAINIQWLWFFGLVGLAVLILACINFVNLSTAQSLGRAKEVGVRKTIGAGRYRLIGQFIGEALVLAVVSGILAILVARIFLPNLNTLTGKTIVFDLARNPAMLGWLAAGILLTSLLAGLYPAFVLSRFRPATTLKSGSVNAGHQSGLLRKALVVSQFGISVCLLIALMLIGKQLKFMRFKDLGFDKENLVLVPVPPRSNHQAKALFGSALSNTKGVKGWAYSTSPPSGDRYTHWGTVMSLVGRDDPNQQEVTTIMTDDRYCELYNLNLKAGRFLTITDTQAVSEAFPEGQRFAKTVVNERLVKALGFESNEAALGKRFWAGVMGWNPEIVGVVEDFNTGSLHEEIKPTLITQYLPFCENVNIRIEAGADLPSTIDRLSLAFKGIFPTAIFEYNFLDQQLDDLYKTEEKLFSLFKIFALLAMLISCLGIWGLITYAAQQKVKEIGIRKTLGASVTDIVRLLTTDFLVLVFIAFLLAAPLAYWGMNRWLEDFAFRIKMGWQVFALAGILALLIALLTVSFQAIRAAMMNPVKSLRSE